MLRKRTGCWILAFLMSIVLMTGLATQVRADEATELNHDVVFVIDASTSMLKADSGNLASEATKLFMDMCVQSSSRVGYVIYNDKIVDSSDVRSIGNPAVVNEIKTALDHPNRSGYTDIGLALKKGVELLMTAPAAEGTRHPLVILLSDGDTVLPPNSVRTMADSENDLNSAISSANLANIPIYTIALNYKNGADESDIDPEKMAEIAKRTDGLSYPISEADQLPKTLSEIFTNSMRTTQQKVDDFTGDGAAHEVIIPIPNASIYEANIIILSGRPVSGIQLADPHGEDVSLSSERASVSSSSVYTLIKLYRPISGDWKLTLVGATGDNITVNLISYYGMDVVLELSDPVYLPGQPIKATLYYQREGEKVEDSALIAGTDGILCVRSADGKESETPMLANGSTMTAEFTPEMSGVYTLYAKAVAKDKAYDKITESIEIEVSAPPIAAVGTGESDLKMFAALLPHEKQIAFEDLFSFESGTVLSLSAPKQTEEKWSDYCDIIHEKETDSLRIEAHKAGKFDATIVARDQYGQTAEHVFHVVIYPIWPAFAVIGVLIVILAVVLKLISDGTKTTLSGHLYVILTIYDADNKPQTYPQEHIKLMYITSRKGKNRLTDVLSQIRKQEFREGYDKLKSLDEIKNAFLEKQKSDDDVLFLYLPGKGKEKRDPISIRSYPVNVDGKIPNGESYRLKFSYKREGFDEGKRSTIDPSASPDIIEDLDNGFQPSAFDDLDSEDDLG